MDEAHRPEERLGVRVSTAESVAERVARVSNWLTQEGRFLANNYELLGRFCATVVDAGVPLARAWLHVRTLHPEFAGVSRLWRRGMKIEERYLDFGFEKTPVFLNSPVRLVVEERQARSWRLDGGEPLPFPVLEELRAAGYVHYAIAPIIYTDGTANAVSWASDAPGGFGDADLRFFEAILPIYAAVVELKGLRRFATNVLSTYVGKEPGELILKGQIRRGEVRTITAALLIADLRDFTGISDTLGAAEVIDLLNRYFDCVMPPIQRRGGEILEFMGDGILAIFNENGERSAKDACRLALDAAKEAIDALATLNRAPSMTQPLSAGFALHRGQVSYGNIGAGDRLDFTVIGPDVNLTSRIERLNRELDRQLIMSEAFVRYLDLPMFEIGHFRLRGFSRMQLLYGLPPE
jgi:adenylate cyclase